MPDDIDTKQHFAEPDEPEPAEVDPDDIDFDEIGPEDPDPDYDPAEHMSQEELAELARQAEDAERDYEASLVRDALRGISKDAAKGYLAKYGDAVDARIRACLEEAKQLALQIIPVRPLRWQPLR